LFTQLGANDPEFNLRKDSSFIIRRENTANTLFVNTIETHGSYSPVSEIAINTRTKIKEISVLVDTTEYSVVSITLNEGAPIVIYLANKNHNKNQSHTVLINGVEKKWTGPYYITIK
jgi:hypothetical protein